jgi:hypothetical protein
MKRWSREFDLIHNRNLQIVHSEWAQDGFCVQIYDDVSNVLLQSLVSRRFMDQFISFELAMVRSLRLFLQPTMFQFEGGNILMGDDFALVGKNTLATNWRERLRQCSETEIEDQAYLTKELELMKAEIQLALGVQEVLWVGYPGLRRDLFCEQQTTYQPDFHIDLFLTLGGRNLQGEELVFVGDPGMATEILLKAGFEIAPTAHGLAWDEELLIDQFVEDSFSFDMVQYFYVYNINGNKRKFKTIAIPLLIESGSAYSFNNCLVEVTALQKRVFLPNYLRQPTDHISLSRRELVMNQKLAVLQEAVERIFKEQGFDDVIWTGDGAQMQHFARRRGSLHCLTKVLRRNQSGFRS